PSMVSRPTAQVGQVNPWTCHRTVLVPPADGCSRCSSASRVPMEASPVAPVIAANFRNCLRIIFVSPPWKLNWFYKCQFGNPESIPQGLKPPPNLVVYGTTKVVP